MKINRIENSNHIIGLNRTSVSYASVPLKYEADMVSFSGKNQGQEGLLEKVKSFFKIKPLPELLCITPRKNKSGLSEEELKSEEIKHIIGTSVECYRKATNLGKEFEKELKSFLATGKKYNYRGRISYNENVNLTFSDIDEKTGVPTYVNVWKNGQYQRSYEIEEMKPEIHYILTEHEPDSQFVYKGIGPNVVHFWQLDREEKNVMDFEVTEQGFNYTSGKLNGHETELKIAQRVYFDFDDYKWCMYFENSPEGIHMYTYNYDEDVWQHKAVIDNSESD